MSQPTGWRVLNQNHTEKYLTNGNFEKMVEVHGMSDSGTAFTVDVPEAKYGVASVIAAGDELAARINAVAALGNGTT